MVDSCGLTPLSAHPVLSVVHRVEYGSHVTTLPACAHRSVTLAAIFNSAFFRGSHTTR